MRVTIFVTSLVLFGAGIALSFLGSAAGATATYSAAVLTLVFVFLPEFKKFKGLGIEAELLDRKIEEADRLLSQLRDLAVPISEMLWSSAARIGRWDSAMPRAKQYRLVERIERELLKCGVTPAQLEQSKVDWHYFNLHDLCAPVLSAISNALKPHLSERQAILNSFPQPIAPERKEEYEGLIEYRNIVQSELGRIRSLYTSVDQPNIVDAIRSTISKSKVLDEAEKAGLEQDLEDAIADIAYYVEHKEFRRLEAWIAQDSKDGGEA